MYTQVRASSVRALREARGITVPPLLYRPRTHRHAYNHTNMRIRAQFIIIKRAMERHAACALLPATLHRDATPSSLRNVSSISPSLPARFLRGMHFVGGECFRNV